MNGNGAEADKSKTAGQLGVEKGEGAANAPVRQQMSGCS